MEAPTQAPSAEKFLQDLAGLVQGRTGDRFLKGAAMYLGKPTSARLTISVLGLHRLDPGQHLHQMLGLGVLLGGSTN